jgi:hypothetical protein
MRAEWRVSSYSSGPSGNCVEVGRADGLILLRDTKDRAGVTLPVPATTWDAFISKAR